MKVQDFTKLCLNKSIRVCIFNENDPRTPLYDGLLKSISKKYFDYEVTGFSVSYDGQIIDIDIRE